jgi:periplasmic divalent cation tolerance protein
VDTAKQVTIKQVTITVPDEATAQHIAAWAVDGNLAACAQIAGPITSVYRWKGNRHNDPEWVVTLKTTAAGYDRLLHGVPKHHPYELPEILCVDVAGEPAYLRWVAEQVTGQP